MKRAALLILLVLTFFTHSELPLYAEEHEFISKTEGEVIQVWLLRKDPEGRIYGPELMKIQYPKNWDIKSIQTNIFNSYGGDEQVKFTVYYRDITDNSLITAIIPPSYFGELKINVEKVIWEKKQ